MMAAAWALLSLMVWAKGDNELNACPHPVCASMLQTHATENATVSALPGPWNTSTLQRQPPAMSLAGGESCKLVFYKDIDHKDEVFTWTKESKHQKIQYETWRGHTIKVAGGSVDLFLDDESDSKYIHFIDGLQNSISSVKAEGNCRYQLIQWSKASPHTRGHGGSSCQTQSLVNFFKTPWLVGGEDRGWGCGLKFSHEDFNDKVEYVRILNDDECEHWRCHGCIWDWFPEC